MNKCKHCGKDIEKDVKVCPHCQKSLEETQDNKALIDSVKAAVAEGISPLSKSVEDIDKRLKAVEKLPFSQRVGDGPAIIVPEVHRGYKVHEQGERLFEKFVTSPHRFKTLSRPEKFVGFVKFMLDVKAALMGNQAAIMSLQKATDMAEGTDSVGGYTVPVEYQPDLVKLAVDMSFALQNCTVINMGSNVLKIPTELTRVSVTWEDEAGSIDEQNSTFDQVTLTAKKLAGLTSGISSELLQDSTVDIVSLLTEQFMYAMGLELDNQVLNGTGSPCSGVLSAACGNSVVMATGSTNFSAITADHLSQMIYALSEEDASKAKFVYNRLIQHYIRTAKDTYGQYIWQKPAEGRPGTIWEVPYFQSIKATGTTGTSTAFVALGNWEKFFLGRRIGTMAFASDPYTDFAKDQIRFRAIMRWALSIARSSAFCRLLTAA